jgi:LytS/YehU family sensor histidine kinase
MAYSDSINNQEKERTIQELEARYQSARNKQKVLEQELMLIELEKSKQVTQQALDKLSIRFWFILIMAVILVIIVLLVFGLLDQRRKKQTLIAERELISHKLALAKKQLEPHFILNALNSISLLFQKNDQDEAVYYMGKTAALINQSLMNADKFVIDLADELSFVENYLCLQTRLLEHFTFEIDQSHVSDNDQISIPFSLVFTFAENAIKHGLRRKEGTKHLQIKLIREIQYLKIEIADNGIGRAKSKQLKTTDTGKGMLIVKNIIEAYNKIHQGRISYEVNDRFDETGEVAGTIVTIKV